MARKLYATINDSGTPIELVRRTPTAPWEPAKEVDVDILRTGTAEFSVMLNGRSFRVLVQKEDTEENTVRMRINGRTYVVALQDEASRLMQELGMDKMAGLVAKDLKAPMPGLVLDLLVKEGDRVKKNDPVLVLEAMKMENMIKAPGDATVTRILVQKGTAVEKGELLLTFGE